MKIIIQKAYQIQWQLQTEKLLTFITYMKNKPESNTCPENAMALWMYNRSLISEKWDENKKEKNYSASMTLYPCLEPLTST